MSSVVVSLLGWAGGTLASSAVVILLVRRMIEQLVDGYFERAKAQFDAQLARQADWARARDQRMITGLPGLHQLAYDANLAARWIAGVSERRSLLHPDLLTACRELSTSLLSFRIYLEPEVFEVVHDFKHVLQDLMNACDTFSREGAPDTLTPESQVSIRRLTQAVEQKFEVVDKALRRAFAGPSTTALASGA